MADISKAHSLLDGGRHIVIPMADGDDEQVHLETLLKRSVAEFGADEFTAAEFQAVLNTFTEQDVDMRGCKGALRQLLDPGCLRGAQLGTTADFNYRLASSVRDRHQTDSTQTHLDAGST